MQGPSRTGPRLFATCLRAALAAFIVIGLLPGVAHGAPASPARGERGAKTPGDIAKLTTEAESGAQCPGNTIASSRARIADGGI